MEVSHPVILRRSRGQIIGQLCPHLDGWDGHEIRCKHIMSSSSWQLWDLNQSYFQWLNQYESMVSNMTNGVYTILVSTFNPEVWNLKPILSKYLQIKWFWMVKFCKVPKNRDILFLPAVWQERLPGKIRSDHMWLLIVAWWPWWFDVSSCAARPFWL